MVLLDFVDVIDERMVETNLNNIWLNGRKISDNIFKYKRRDSKRISYEHGALRRPAVGDARKVIGGSSREVQGPPTGA